MFKVINNIPKNVNNGTQLADLVRGQPFTLGDGAVYLFLGLFSGVRSVDDCYRALVIVSDDRGYYGAGDCRSWDTDEKIEVSLNVDVSITVSKKAEAEVIPKMAELDENEKQLIASGKKIDAIKAYRERVGNERRPGLKESKDAIDAYCLVQENLQRGRGW